MSTETEKQSLIAEPDLVSEENSPEKPQSVNYPSSSGYTEEADNCGFDSACEV